MTTSKVRRTYKDVKAVILFEALAAFLALIAAGTWYRVTQALDDKGVASPRFNIALFHAATATMLTLGLAGIAGLLFLIV